MGKHVEKIVEGCVLMGVEHVTRRPNVHTVEKGGEPAARGTGRKLMDVNSVRVADKTAKRMTKMIGRERKDCFCSGKRQRVPTAKPSSLTPCYSPLDIPARLCPLSVFDLLTAAHMKHGEPNILVPCSSCYGCIVIHLQYTSICYQELTRSSIPNTLVPAPSRLYKAIVLHSMNLAYG